MAAFILHSMLWTQVAGVYDHPCNHKDTDLTTAKGDHYIVTIATGCMHMPHVLLPTLPANCYQLHTSLVSIITVVQFLCIRFLLV